MLFVSSREGKDQSKPFLIPLRPFASFAVNPVWLNADG